MSEIKNSKSHIKEGTGKVAWLLAQGSPLHPAIRCGHALYFSSRLAPSFLALPPTLPCSPQSPHHRRLSWHFLEALQSLLKKCLDHKMFRVRSQTLLWQSGTWRWGWDEERTDAENNIERFSQHTCLTQQHQPPASPAHRSINNINKTAAPTWALQCRHEKDKEQPLSVRAELAACTWWAWRGEPVLQKPNTSHWKRQGHSRKPKPTERQGHSHKPKPRVWWTAADTRSLGLCVESSGEKALKEKESMRIQSCTTWWYFGQWHTTYIVVVFSECICHVVVMQPSWFEEAHTLCALLTMPKLLMVQFWQHAPSDKWRRYHCTWVTISHLFWRQWLKGSWKPLCAAHTHFLTLLFHLSRRHLLVHSQGHPRVKCGLAFFGSHSLSFLLCHCVVCGYLCH